MAIPNEGHFQWLTIESGAKLTISADAILRFCEGGRLVVEPNAELHLYGKLTAECAAGWDGVQVQGNAAYPQTYESSIQGYRQGRVFLYPGSVIEHAQTGVALYGPGNNDTGGQLAANGSTLLNNRVGIAFLPYANLVPVLGGTQRRPYAARIVDCTFETDEAYSLENQFYSHIYMIGVDDVPILGSRFRMSQSVANADNVGDYGYGILAVHAGFRVEDLPCPPPCTSVQRSVFDGLGYGIWAGSLFGSRPYVIDHAEFKRNYYGIASQAVASVNITRNIFLFSDVPDPSLRNDQIGIHLAGNVVTIKLQENHFTRNGGDVEHALGIVSENLGTQDIKIKKNYFSGMTIANEAFGRNAMNLSMTPTGLHYVCNQNTGTEDIDFYVKNALPTADIIRNDQSELVFVDGGLFKLAAGNTFSTTTNSAANDDFANLGDEEIIYRYYQSGIYQEPVRYEGLSAIVSAPINFCEIEASCRIPCLTSNDYGAARYLLNDQLSAFSDAIGSNDTIGAIESRLRMDSATHAVLDYFLLDTLLIARDDSMRLLLAARGEIEHLFWLAGMHAVDGDTSEAFAVLDSISMQFLTQFTELASQTEISKVIWRNAVGHGILGISGGYADSLAGYAQRYGLAGAMARNVLAINQVSFPPRYFLPGEMNPRSIQEMNDRSVENLFGIRPNPTSDYIEVLNYNVSDDPMFFDVVSMDGRLMLHGRLVAEITRLDIRDLPSGLYIIKVYSAYSGAKGAVRFFKLGGR